MANDFVNTITTSNGTTYDVQDKRLEVTAADAGKVVSVDSNGNLSLITPSSGTKLYKHTIVLSFLEDDLQEDLTLVLISTSHEPIASTDSAKTYKLGTDYLYGYALRLGIVGTDRIMAGEGCSVLSFSVGPSTVSSTLSGYAANIFNNQIKYDYLYLGGPVYQPLTDTVTEL